MAGSDRDRDEDPRPMRTERTTGNSGRATAGLSGARRRTTRMARGDIRTAILALLSDNAQHGYQMIQQIAERSRGLWRPSAGSIYPALQQLSAEGLVRAEQSGGRRVFQLTDDGRRYIAERDEELAAVWDSIGERFDDGVLELRESAAQVMQATTQISEMGTPDQLAAAQEILATARKQLYRLLADGNPAQHDARHR